MENPLSDQSRIEKVILKRDAFLNFAFSQKRVNPAFNIAKFFNSHNKSFN